jgi:hypothetical protein
MWGPRRVKGWYDFGGGRMDLWFGPEIQSVTYLMTPWRRLVTFGRLPTNDPLFKNYTVIAIPHWVFGALFGLMPAIRLRHWMKRRRPDLCPACGYDLRGTPSGGQSNPCPECGAASGKQEAKLT